MTSNEKTHLAANIRVQLAELNVLVNKARSAGLTVQFIDSDQPVDLGGEYAYLGLTIRIYERIDTQY